LLQVALGGGRKYFQPENTTDPEYPSRKNDRDDGQDLIAKWLQANHEEGVNAAYVWNQTSFDTIDADTTDKLLGIFFF